MAPASVTNLRSQDPATGAYTVHPHPAEPYPKGHADTTSCVRCGKRLDHVVHSTDPIDYPFRVMESVSLPAITIRVDGLDINGSV